MVRASVALLACVGGLLAGAPSAFALTRAQADAVAFGALKPTGSRAAVYGLPSALPAGTAVSDAGPGPGERFAVTDNGLGSGATLQATVRRMTLSAPGWLFWEDPSAGANFPHASRLLLVDDATGKVAWTQTLAWWPLVNDKPAAFYLHSSLAQYRVTASVEAQAVAQVSYPHDCMIALVDTSDHREFANFNGDATAMLGLARSHDMPAAAAVSLAGLVEYANSFVDKGCDDIVVFLAGHGTPSSGPGETEDPSVILSYHYAPAANGSQTVVTDSAVTASDLKGLVKQFAGKANFKFLINSCYSGRFVSQLDTQPGVALVAASSASDEPSIEAVAGDTQADHPQDAGTWVVALTKTFDAVLDGNVPGLGESTVQKAKDDLAYALETAAAINDTPSRSMDKAVRLGLTHPIAVLNSHVGEAPVETPTTPAETATKPAKTSEPPAKTSPTTAAAIACQATRPVETDLIWSFAVTCNRPFSSLSVSAQGGGEGYAGPHEPAGWSGGGIGQGLTFMASAFAPAGKPVTFTMSFLNKVTADGFFVEASGQDFTYVKVALAP